MDLPSSSSSSDITEAACQPGVETESNINSGPINENSKQGVGQDSSRMLAAAAQVTNKQ